MDASGQGDAVRSPPNVSGGGPADHQLMKRSVHGARGRRHPHRAEEMRKFQAQEIETWKRFAIKAKVQQE